MFSLVKIPASQLSIGQVRFRRFGVSDFRRRQFLLVLSRNETVITIEQKANKNFALFTRLPFPAIFCSPFCLLPLYL
jgi:hypothetical protein